MRIETRDRIEEAEETMNLFLSMLVNIYCWLVCVNMIQARVICKKGTSIEKMSSENPAVAGQ